jgi:predicted HicB family RNase H-like nuclease
MKYKNYVAHVEYDDSIEAFHGRILGIEDVISFEGESVAKLKRAFENAVDDYLAWCAEENRVPQKTHSGRLLVRLGPELHRKVIILAEEGSKSANQFIVEVLESATREKE